MAKKKEFDWWSVIKGATKDRPESHQRRKREQDKAIDEASGKRKKK